jgi:hypothetical protein
LESKSYTDSTKSEKIETMRAYIGCLTKLLNAVEDVSVDRKIDTFNDGIQRES